MSLQDTSVGGDDLKKVGHHNGKNSEPADERVSMSSLVIVLLRGFVDAIEYSILVPTVWQYLRGMGSSKAFLGLVMASYSVGRLLVYIPVGIWCDKRGLKEPFVVCMLLQMIGSMLYGLASYCHEPNLVLAGRFLVGLGCSSTALVNVFISKAIPEHKQVKMFSIQNGVQLIGNVAGPAMNYGLIHLNTKFRIIELNEMTAAGYLLVPPNLLLVILFLFVFKNPKVREGDQKLRSLDGATTLTKMESVKMIASEGGWWPLVAMFVVGYTISALETAVTPISHERFGWKTLQNSIFFGAIAVVAMLGVIFTIVMAKLLGLSPRTFTVIGQLCMFVSVTFAVFFYGLNDDARALTKEATETSFYFVGGLLIFGTVIFSNNVSGIYSMYLKGHDKGFFLSICQMCIAIGRCVGALIAGVATSTSATTLFLCVDAGIVISPLLMLFVWKQLKQFSKQKNSTNGRQRDVQFTHNVSTGKEYLSPQETQPLLHNGINND
eukprot:m.12086 g.12086  ORF g.12086 m.12086 type:complete len:493 (+) comp9134_c0_seq2:135-1613(+)